MERCSVGMVLLSHKTVIVSKSFYINVSSPFTQFPKNVAEYKPVLKEVEKILAEAGLDEDEIKRGAVAGPKAAQGESRNRR